MVGLQCGRCIVASQALVAVALAELLELLNSKVSTAGASRSSPLTTIVGLRTRNFFRVILSPFLAASYYLFTLALIVIKFRSGHKLCVICRPLLLVLG